MLNIYTRVDIPLSHLENPKTAESSLKALGHSAKQLALEHNLQGFTLICYHTVTLLTLFSFSFLGPLPVYVVCHHGNDSQKAVAILQKHFSSLNKLPSVVVKDVSSGLSGWARTVDPTFPEY